MPKLTERLKSTVRGITQKNLRNATISQNELEIDKRLGGGAYGEVHLGKYKGTDRNIQSLPGADQHVAVKMVRENPTMKDYEAVLKTLQSATIPEHFNDSRIRTQILQFLRTHRPNIPGLNQMPLMDFRNAIEEHVRVTFTNYSKQLDSAKEEFKDEGQFLENLSRLQTPNSQFVVKGYAATVIEEGVKKARIVTQAAENGSLEDLCSKATQYRNDGITPTNQVIRALIEDPDVVLAQFFNSAQSGLHHLAAANIVHRDLATRNYLVPSAKIEDGQAVGFTTLINDFGKSKNTSNMVVNGNSIQAYKQTDMSESLAYKWMNNNAINNRIFDTAGDLYSTKMAMIEMIGKLIDPNYNPHFTHTPSASMIDYVIEKKKFSDAETLSILVTQLDNQVSQLNDPYFKYQLQTLIGAYRNYLTSVPEISDPQKLLQSDKTLLLEANAKFASIHSRDFESKIAQYSSESALLTNKRLFQLEIKDADLKNLLLNQQQKAQDLTSRNTATTEENFDLVDLPAMSLPNNLEAEVLASNAAPSSQNYDNLLNNQISHEVSNSNRQNQISTATLTEVKSSVSDDIFVVDDSLFDDDPEEIEQNSKNTTATPIEKQEEITKNDAKISHSKKENTVEFNSFKQKLQHFKEMERKGSETNLDNTAPTSGMKP